MKQGIPSAISMFRIWFEVGMEEVEFKTGLLLQRAKGISRQLGFAFQLLDDNHDVISCDGHVTFEMEWEQNIYGTYPTGGNWVETKRKGTTKVEREVKATNLQEGVRKSV